MPSGSKLPDRGESLIHFQRRKRNAEAAATVTDRKSQRTKIVQLGRLPMWCA